MSNTLTPGQYLRDCRRKAGLSRWDVAMRIETVPAVSVIRRAEEIAAIEDEVQPVGLSSAITLALIPELRISLKVLATLVDDENDLTGLRFSPPATLEETTGA